MALSQAGKLLVRLFAVNTAIRFGLSALFVGAIAALDLGHMGRLLSGGETWPFAILLCSSPGSPLRACRRGLR